LICKKWEDALFSKTTPRLSQKQIQTGQLVTFYFYGGVWIVFSIVFVARQRCGEKPFALASIIFFPWFSHHLF
jgi:hypothetical protein